MNSLEPGTHAFVANGIRQVYHVAGSGPVMITLSGGPGVEYTYLRSTRLEKNFTMVYAEPAGTGESGPLPEDATFVETYVDLLDALVEHLGVPRIHLLGHSHGGFTAQGLALRRGDRVAGLILYSTSPVTDGEFWAAVKVKAATYLERHAGIPDIDVVAAAFNRPDSRVTHAEKTAILRDYLPLYFADFWGRRAEFDLLRRNVRAWAVQVSGDLVDYRSRLSSLTVPTLVVTGRHDFICGPAWSEMLHRGIQGSRLVILENSGHFGHLEEPEAFHDAVEALFSDNRGRPVTE
ncbi:alpha/beta fold hydrolase [Actinoplanes palleronii]|uniref:Hydrolase n=1 Tax=Actinoplanes palleronii TaxID=113570 RepID=A0ABQ4B5F1_9ACTN|nr:alpha/beta hydrolase [Actinoplanes palleronii]GIE65902.1 hydrolase [Actinoplanes palleronii]